MLMQNWIAWPLNVWRRPRFSLGWSYQFMVGTNQIRGEPRDFSASSYAFQFLVRHFCGASFMCSHCQTSRFYVGRRDLRNEALRPYETCRVWCRSGLGEH
jgi:hypothetical protein